MTELDELEKNETGINVTPLVDVCLVLVLFFMVTMPLSAIYGVRVKQETLAKYGLTTPQENIMVHLTHEGVYVMDTNNKEKLIRNFDFGVVIGGMLQKSTGKQVIFHVDPTVAHGTTVWALDMAKQNGAEGVSFLQGA